MIPIMLITAGVVVAAGLVAKFWERIHNYLKKLHDKLKEIIKDTIKGMKIYLTKENDKFQQKTVTYSQDEQTGMWTETIVKKEILAEDIPREYRERVTMDEEFDMSEEYKAKLKMTK